MEEGMYRFNSENTDLDLVINIDVDCMGIFLEDKISGEGIILDEAEAKKLLEFLKIHIGE